AGRAKGRGDAMIGFIIRALVAALGLWVASKIVPGIEEHSWKSLLPAAFILGIVNAVVRPILTILTLLLTILPLPLTILTLGLFLLVINGLMLMLASAFLHGFVVHGLWAAILGSIVV